MKEGGLTIAMASRIQARSTADCSSTGMNTYDQSTSTRRFMGLQPSSSQLLAVIHLNMVHIVTRPTFLKVALWSFLSKAPLRSINYRQGRVSVE